MIITRLHAENFLKYAELEFNDLPAFGADHVIVVFAGIQLEIRLAALEVVLDDQPRGF